ncbi:HTH-type transcriptional regulator GntR [compost metagenome]
MFDQTRYEQLLQELLAEHPDIDGIFATSDIIGAFAIKECERAGKKVPDDVKIVGYDDVTAARWLTPELTSIRQPIDEFGKLAVELLSRQVEGEAVQIENTLPVELVVRGTA